MNTLYDRLETEVLLGLLENEKNYASGTKAIVTALKTNYSWLSLTIGQVRNPFSGDTCLLTAEELSMYDLIKGAEMVLQMSVAMDNEACYDIVEKGCKWFRSVNPQAYMTLLD